LPDTAQWGKGGGGCLFIVSPNLICAHSDVDETLPNFIKTKHPRRGKKKKQGVIRTKVQASKQLEYIKQGKGNECSQYKTTAAMFSSSVPICPIHIFSTDTQACFALVTSYNMTCFTLVTSNNMPSDRLHTPLYP